MDKKKCLCALLTAVALVACLVGCGREVLATADAGSTWNGISATEATPKDKVKFKLQEDSECDACHALEAASAQNELCLAGDPEHAELVCLDCHTKDTALDGAHRKLSADSDASGGLKRTSVDDQTCLTSDCHTLEEVAAGTPDDAVLVDANGTAVNPHDIHNIGQSHGDIKCADCHVTHQEGEALQHANDKCLSCHHENVYECGTCH